MSDEKKAPAATRAGELHEHTTFYDRLQWIRRRMRDIETSLLSTAIVFADASHLEGMENWTAPFTKLLGESLLELHRDGKKIDHMQLHFYLTSKGHKFSAYALSNITTIAEPQPWLTKEYRAEHEELHTRYELAVEHLQAVEHALSITGDAYEY